MPRQIILGIFILATIVAFFSTSCEKDSTTEPKTETINLTKVSGDNQEAVLGDTLSTPLVVLVTEDSGRALSERRVDFRITAGIGTLSDSIVVTDNAGKAETTLILGEQEGQIQVEAKVYGTEHTVTFTSTSLPQPFSITIVCGNDQQGVQGDTLSTPLTVLVTDNGGKAVSDKQVDFTIKEGDGTLSVESINTDDNGQASTILTLGNQQGLILIEAKISNTKITALFTAIIGIHKPYSIEIINGDGQVACPGEVLPEPLQVVIKDDRGRPFEGAVVTFNIEEGTGSLSALSDTTSISGVAQTIFSFGDSIGTSNIIASLQGTDSPASVKFTANAVPPTIEIVRGNDQYGDPGDILPDPLQVKVVNNRNEPINGIIVNFKILLGNGSLSALSDTTNSLGIAQTTLTLGDSVGITEISAELQGMESIDIVTFTATTLPPVINIIGGNNQMCYEREIFPEPLQVQVKSGKGVPLENFVVTFSIDESIGELSVLNSTTNSNGIAETQLTAGNVPGYVKITASIQSIDSPVDFIEIVLSPSRIAFTSDRDGNHEIYVMNTNGSVQINLTDHPDYDGYPSWSPDGSQIAFRSYRDGNGEIYVMDADGSNQTNLTNNPNDDFRPLWSPDGSQIAFRSDINGNSEIYVMNSDGSNQTNLTNNSTGDYSPSWSPDGYQIVWVSGYDVHSEIYVMNADGSNLKKLTTDSYWDSSPSWSPDGSQIVFDSRRYGDNIEIFVIDADGSNQTNLTNNSNRDFWPIWSPDGSQIAFCFSRDGDGGIYVMNSDGSNQTNLTTEINFTISWSPDGYQIAFESWRDGNSEIYVMDKDGSNQTNLTNNYAADSSPSWSPLQR